MKYAPYPQYAKLDSHYLQEIPDTWHPIRLRFVIHSNPVKSEISSLPSDTLVSFVPMEAVSENGVMSLEKEKNLEDVYSGYTYFRNDDVVIAKITPCFENGKGAIASQLTNGLGFGTTEFHVLRTIEGTDQHWLFYLTKTDTFRRFGESEMYGAGGQKRVPDSFIKNFVVGFPLFQEQKQIVNFLDYKTAQLDRLIEKKKQLIEKLNEKRIAVITQAVTKGLDPSVPMKDSGVDWLGEIPIHWEVRRIKLLAIEPLKYGANEPAQLDDRDYPRYIRITDVMEDGSLHDDTFRSLEPEIAEPYLLEDGDILLARSGATVGKSFIYEKSWGAAAYAGYLIRFRIDPKAILAEFAYFFLRSTSYWANINSTLIQSTIQNFSAEKYGNIVMPLPLLAEQNKILAFIRKEISIINKSESLAANAIERLAEYRTALITAAVTGKIDVRGVQIPNGETTNYVC